MRSGTIPRFVLVPAFVLSACGDDFGPGTWSARPDTTVIYSASRPELLLMPAAFDVVNLARIIIENPTATGTWDFALVEQDGQFLMAPAAALTRDDSRAGIALSSATALVDVEEAPGDTASFSRALVPVEIGRVYIVRSRRESCFTFGVGVRYAKLKALEVDPAAGTFRFEVVRNPNCNDRALVPPED